jgi:hypothetical protein
LFHGGITRDIDVVQEEWGMFVAFTVNGLEAAARGGGMWR